MAQSPQLALHHCFSSVRPCNVDNVLYVNDVDHGPIHLDVHGKALPHLQGCQVVPEQHVFLASTQPYSLDSRYFGPVRVTDLTAQALPLLTW